MNIQEMVKQAHEDAVKHGWWDNPPEVGTAIALIHSELSEALEESRSGKYPRDTYFECKATPQRLESYCGKEKEGICTAHEDDRCEHAKPCGIPSELADAVIRIADLCGHMGIDLEAAIVAKMEYNKGRPFKHGGKLF